MRAAIISILVLVVIGLVACTGPDASVSLDPKGAPARVMLEPGSYISTMTWRYEDPGEAHNTYLVHETGPDGPHNYTVRLDDTRATGSQGHTDTGTTWQTHRIDARAYSGGTYTFTFAGNRSNTPVTIDHVELRFYKG